jgi:hypothetical protein
MIEPVSRVSAPILPSALSPPYDMLGFGESSSGLSQAPSPGGAGGLGDLFFSFFGPEGHGEVFRSASKMLDNTPDPAVLVDASLKTHVWLAISEIFSGFAKGFRTALNSLTQS